MSERYAEVIVDLSNEAVDRLFTYRIPAGMALTPGQRVEVPFGPRTLEGFVLAVTYQAIVLLIQKAFDIREMIQVATEGIKSVVSAMLILSLAYCINAISKTLGTSSYVISVTESWMTPVTLLALTFAVCAFMSFFTGTSWGVYAIMIPIVMPLAFNMTGGERCRRGEGDAAGGL